MVHFLVECFPRELIVIELHTLESFSGGSCARCSEAESVWERGSDVQFVVWCWTCCSQHRFEVLRDWLLCCIPSICPASSGDTLWSDESASEDRDVHNVENFVLCSSAHRACSPLSQEGLPESFWRVASPQTFSPCAPNEQWEPRRRTPSGKEKGRTTARLSLCSGLAMRRCLCWSQAGDEGGEGQEREEDEEGGWWQGGGRCCVATSMNIEVHQSQVLQCSSKSCRRERCSATTICRLGITRWSSCAMNEDDVVPRGASASESKIWLSWFSWKRVERRRRNIPVADGRVIPGGDRRLRPSTLIWDRPERREEQEVFRVNQADSSPNSLQDDSTRDDAEAKNDFWSITWDFHFSPSRGTSSQTVRAERRIISYSAEVHRRYQKNTCITGRIVGETYWWLLERGWENYQIHGQVSQDSLYWMKCFLTDIHGPGGDWRGNKQPKDPTMYGQICGGICPMQRKGKRSKSWLSRNQSSIMPSNYVVSSSLNQIGIIFNYFEKCS